MTVTVPRHESLPSGTAQTVLGPVSGDALGVTLPHEHLLIDLTRFFTEPAPASEKTRAHQPITLQNRFWVQYNRNHWDNLLLACEETAVTEAARFKRAGGSTIVEVTSVGIGRDPEALARIARATGLHIIMGCGPYVAASHAPDMDGKREEDIAADIVRDLTVGVGATGIRAGVIGEVGCSWPLHDNERKSLRAAARAQRETGAVISVHPGRHDSAPLEILDILAGAGADLGRTIMGHMERTVRTPGTLKAIAGAGCFLEYDFFGREISYYALAPEVDLPSDAQRLAQLSALIGDGYLDQLLLSHDVSHRVTLVRYGGSGYAHLLENVVPRMRLKGFKEDHIQTMLVGNPRRAFTFP